MKEGGIMKGGGMNGGGGGGIMGGIMGGIIPAGHCCPLAPPPSSGCVVGPVEPGTCCSRAAESVVSVGWGCCAPTIYGHTTEMREKVSLMLYMYISTLYLVPRLPAAAAAVEGGGEGEVPFLGTWLASWGVGTSCGEAGVCLPQESCTISAQTRSP